MGPGYKRVVQLTNPDTGLVIVGYQLPMVTADIAPAMAPSGEALVWPGPPDQQRIPLIKVHYPGQAFELASLEPAQPSAADADIPGHSAARWAQGCCGGRPPSLALVA